MIKNLVKIGAAVLTTLLAIMVLWQFRIAVVYVLISLILAASIRPLFTRLTGRRLMVRLIWIFIYIIVFFGLSYILLLTIKTSATELQMLADGVSVDDKWTLLLWSDSSGLHSLFERLPSPSVIFQTIVGNEGELVIPVIFGIVQDVGGVVAAFAIILILSIYWGINKIHFERLWLSLLPPDQRKQVRSIWRTIEPDIGAYVRGQILHSLVAGILLGFGFWLIGSPSPALLALIGAITSMIPVVGLILTVFITGFIGLLTSVKISLLTAIFAIIILTTLAIWVKPRLTGRRWDNPILTLILLIAMADVFGIVGIIIAPLLSVVCQILWKRLVSHREVTGQANMISDLKERLEHLRETVSDMEEPNLPLITSSMQRISNLLDAAEPVLRESASTEMPDSHHSA